VGRHYGLCDSPAMRPSCTAHAHPERHRQRDPFLSHGRALVGVEMNVSCNLQLTLMAAVCVGSWANRLARATPRRNPVTSFATSSTPLRSFDRHDVVSLPEARTATLCCSPLFVSTNVATP